MPLACLWPVVAWDDGMHFCRRCNHPITQAEAMPWEKYPVGWCHRPGECPK
jgi:hypothetical protein